MSVTKCEECGYEIGIKIDQCPGCGDKIVSDIGRITGLIRRILILLFALYILLSALRII